MEKHGGNRDEIYKLFSIPGTKFKPEALKSLAKFAGIADLITESEENVSAGYTYLGQFIDHDITQLSVSNENPSERPHKILNLEQLSTSSIDLDSLYGGGDKRQPPLLEDNLYFRGPKNKKGLLMDLPRHANGEYSANSANLFYDALIPDPRNDEHFIISQLHVLFMNAHNRLVDCYRRAGNQDPFGAAKKELILVYQKIVLNDFLKEIIDKKIYYKFFHAKKARLLKPVSSEISRIPVEFSGAAFRFGHSMVTGQYQANMDQTITIREMFELSGKGGFPNGYHLTGAYSIEWERFFHTPYTSIQNIAINNALKIDLRLIDRMLRLPNESQDNNNLFSRNLLRGLQLDLPCAQDIFRFLKSYHKEYFCTYKPKEITAKIFERKFPINLNNEFSEEFYKSDFHVKTPLWLYILLEPMCLEPNSAIKGNRLGPLGSLILAEVFESLFITSEVSIYRENYMEEKNVFVQAIKQSLNRQNFNFDETKMSDLISFVNLKENNNGYF